MHHVLRCQLLGLLLNYSMHGAYKQTTPGLLNASNSEKNNFTIVFSCGLEDQFNATEDALVHLDIFMEPLNVIASISDVSSCDYI